jgi:peptidoglycan hydrolase-like protein with peptidoglycan-binding domain
MRNQILLLALGFVLTSVGGGALGYYFQRRTWKANLRESERQAAAMVFDEISRAMDRRLYRMRRFYWALKRADEDRVAEAIDGYRSVLVEWNDSLNRNLALANRYFGEDVWSWLDGGIYEEFQRLGRHLEERFRQRHDPEPESRGRLLAVGRELTALSDDLYNLNRFMVSRIQHGSVGLYLSTTREGMRLGWPARYNRIEPPPWQRDLRLGSRSIMVKRWQSDLNRVEKRRLSVDGWFGRATHEATIAFQGAHGLAPDGIVGPLTWEKMSGIDKAEGAPGPTR